MPHKICCITNKTVYSMAQSLCFFVFFLSESRYKYHEIVIIPPSTIVLILMCFHQLFWKLELWVRLSYHYNDLPLGSLHPSKLLFFVNIFT